MTELKILLNLKVGRPLIIMKTFLNNGELLVPLVLTIGMIVCLLKKMKVPFLVLIGGEIFYGLSNASISIVYLGIILALVLLEKDYFPTKESHGTNQQ